MTRLLLSLAIATALLVPFNAAAQHRGPKAEAAPPGLYTAIVTEIQRTADHPITPVVLADTCRSNLRAAREIGGRSARLEEVTVCEAAGCVLSADDLVLLEFGEAWRFEGRDWGTIVAVRETRDHRIVTTTVLYTLRPGDGGGWELVEQQVLGSG